MSAINVSDLAIIQTVYFTIYSLLWGPLPESGYAGSGPIARGLFRASEGLFCAPGRPSIKLTIQSYRTQKPDLEVLAGKHAIGRGKWQVPEVSLGLIYQLTRIQGCLIYSLCCQRPVTSTCLPVSGFRTGTFPVRSNVIKANSSGSPSPFRSL